MKLKFKGFDKELNEYPFTIIDVGAYGGIKKEWASLGGYLNLIGFEPCKDNFNELREDDNITYLNSACYNTKRNITLYLTRLSGLSSIFMPNYDFLNHFPQSNIYGYKLKGEEMVKADKLDNILSQGMKEKLDFVKIDVEGAALQVLQGAEETISKGNVVGFLIEAEFNEKYKEQNLFSEVDILMRKYNYQLFNIKPCYWKRKQGTKTGGARGQLIHGDFLYFIEPDKFFDKLQNYDEAKSKIIKFITFCCIYGFYDLALELAEQALWRGFINEKYYSRLRKELNKSTSLIMRLHKLKNRFGLWLAEL